MPQFRPPIAALVALALAGTSIAVIATWPESLGLVPPDLPHLDRQLVEFLLLLPVAALVCCVIRNMVGLYTYGTFAPALLGLSFREVGSPVGVFVMLVVLSIGWIIRRAITRLNLLQVPRSAVMLSVVVALLLAYILFANSRGRSVAGAIPFLPLVIVTGLIERFWTAEEEDGTGPAVRTMIATLATAAAVFVVARIAWVRDTLMEHPETLGIVVAGQLLIGRYTGYRLVELRRFQKLASPTLQDPPE
ncbi:MAG TPA: 7TM domain-containing protein [Gemmataceae bacterium]|nr:7TM domain-containing protein [Gemmataceae bacterium]